MADGTQRPIDEPIEELPEKDAHGSESTHGGPAGQRTRRPERGDTGPGGSLAQQWFSDLSAAEQEKIANDKGLQNSVQGGISIREAMRLHPDDPEVKAAAAQLESNIQQNPELGLLLESYELYRQQSEQVAQGRERLGHEPQQDKGGQEGVPKYTDVPEALRARSEAKGVQPEDIELLLSYEKSGIPPGKEDEAAAVVKRVNAKDPELAAAIKDYVQQAEPPSMDIPEIEDPAQDPAEREAARRRQESQEKMLEAQAAIQRSMDNPSSEELRQEAANKLREAQEYNNQHAADDLQKGDPKWGKFLNGIAVAFILMVGLQYAMAAAVASQGSNRQ